MKKIGIIAVLSLLFGCNSSAQKNSKTESFEVSKTKAEWKSELTDLQFYVMREEGTERAFTSELNNNYNKGLYVCSACDTPLFKSENKFDSGTGWPSFDQEIEGNVKYSANGNSYYGIEEHCAVCGGHLGHVFGDGPKKTTGKRHCINGVSLKFIPENE
jgi:peptide-methionine (R)-S-oxide reductase